MGTTNSTLSSDFSVNISNIIRLFIVTQIELPNILRELLFVKVPPTSLEGLIHKNVYLSSLRAFELGVIATVRTKQYADFDVALMYKIIRNLELVKEPTQGWDKNPPTPTETTIGDDVERIRRSRNDFAHNVNSNISDIELNNRFSLFIDIASRLEVYMNKHNREYVSKIEKVKVCCIDPETEQMYLRQLEILIERETIMQSNMSAVSNSVDELRHQSNINELGLSGLKTKLSTLQTEQEEAIPKNVRDQLNKNTEEWKIKDIKFVPTRASEYVSDQLNKKSCVTLTGSPGMGKTFLARHIALDFQLEGYMIVPVLTPTDIRDYYLPGKQTIFVVDDVCGKFIANQSQLEIWQQMLPKIEQILADDSCKIIATCRLQVYRDDKINLLEPFKICECNLNSKEMCLTQSEKIKIKEKYFGNRNLDDIAQASDFFPLLCSLQWLPEEEGIDVSNLFKSPFEFYKKELDNLYRCGDDGKKKICSLVLCVLFNNFLEIKWFDGRVTDEQRQVLDDVFMACRLNTGTPKTELMDALDTLDGSLVSKGNLTYSTIHDKIFDFLAHYFGGTMIQCLINHSHHNLINERFKWKNSKNISTNEFAIALTDESLKWYLDRLVNDWSHGKVSTVIANSNMNDESFRYKFISFVKELKKTQQEKLANTRDTLQKKEWSTSGSYPIINASFEGYIDIVRWLLDNAVDVNQCRDDGNTSLYMACHNGHKDIVSLLLKKNHFINVFNEIRVTPLFIACEKGYTEIVEALLKHNADVNINMIDGDINLSPLFQATSKGHYDIMKKLLEKNADVNTYDTYGSTPLLLACERGNMEMVRLLISNKANVEMRTYIGASAITVASANGNIEITRFLLESNADVNSCIHRKELISFKAMIRPSKTLENLKENIFNFVLEKGKPRVQQYVRLKSKEYVFDIMAGSSPLHIACCLGHFEIVECLLQYNASVNLTKADGTTPLFYACQLGYDSIVRLLLDKGADTKLCRDDGKSPHALARENGYTYIEKKLRKHSKSNKSLTQ
ncbi:uncharacterized protein LOC134699284 [Mytilus trossulus]|uniref:uncharacterized protein LOC134699284 n=1 Tax=Mytilus trossulus TaxID=6551 RepID=UPI0030055C50